MLSLLSILFVTGHPSDYIQNNPPLGEQEHVAAVWTSSLTLGCNRDNTQNLLPWPTGYYVFWPLSTLASAPAVGPLIYNSPLHFRSFSIPSCTNFLPFGAWGQSPSAISAHLLHLPCLTSGPQLTASSVVDILPYSFVGCVETLAAQVLAFALDLSTPPHTHTQCSLCDHYAGLVAASASFCLRNICNSPISTRFHVFDVIGRIFQDSDVGYLSVIHLPHYFPTSWTLVLHHQFSMEFVLSSCHVGHCIGEMSEVLLGLVISLPLFLSIPALNGLGLFFRVLLFSHPCGSSTASDHE